MEQSAAGQLKTLRTKHSATLDQLDKYKLLVENIEDYAIFLMDVDGYIQTWNKGAEKNKGWTSDEIIGKHFSTFYMQKDIDAQKPEIELKIAKRIGRVEDEDWRIRKDGSKFWANVVITALHGPDGELVGFAKVTRNLTERKQHEDALRKANEALKLQQRELEALNTAKDEFVSLASHQLRTPATSIKQLLGLMLEGFVGEMSAEHKELIQKAYDTNERQIAIVNILLRVAQLDAGKVRLKRTAMPVHLLVENIIDSYKDTLTQREQTLQYKKPKDVAATIAAVDPSYLRMAMENIVDNASKYTHGGGTISISVTGTKNTVKVAIKDTGVGISEEDKAKLFQRFSRIPNDLSEVMGGSGLGLFWSHKVIELHGGRVDVDSERHKGTTFTITLTKEGLHA